MKIKTLYFIWGIEAAACGTLCIARVSFSGLLTAAAAFPMAQIAQGLRMLSLSCATGNVVAVLLYSMVCLSPVVVRLCLMKRYKLRAEDGLLVLLCIVLFAVLYQMINPGGINAQMNGAVGRAVMNAVLGGTVYSILCGYAVLRALRLFLQTGVERINRYLTIVLGLVGAVFICAVCGVAFAGTINAFAALHSDNVTNTQLPIHVVYLLLQFIAEALPYAFNLPVIVAAIKLLEALRVNPYAAETVTAAERLSRRCITALTVTVLTQVSFNVFQFLFMRSLSTVNVTVQISMVSIVFALAALLLTRFVMESKRLQDDNNLFI